MLTYLTAGESHGKSLTAVVSGMPAGLPVDFGRINADLARRQSGYGRGKRMQIEADKVECTSGIRFGKTIGSPVTFVIHNKDWDNWTDVMSVDGEETGERAVTRPRPGHADLPGAMKFGHRDMRNILERASARHTATLVAVGSLAKELLAYFGIEVFSHVASIGGINADVAGLDYATLRERLKKSELCCADPDAEKRMIEKIKEAQEQGDSLGGTFEVIALRVPAGLGSVMDWDEKLDGRLARAVMAINAVKGVEIGLGFGAAALPGSRVHDEIFYTDDRKTLESGCHKAGKFYRNTNHAGGLEGGITNGEPVVVRAAIKPIPTLMKPLKSVDIETKKSFEAAKERSDVCVVPAAGVIGEAAVAFELARAFLEMFGGGNIAGIKARYESYLKSLDEF